MNGFRRFFNKVGKEALSHDSPLAALIKEYMMGYQGTTPLDQNYFKTDVLELAAEYVNIVPDLTIDDSERLKRSNRRMADNIQRREDEKDEKIARLEGQIRRMEEEMSKISDRGGATADEILNAFLKSPKAGEVAGEVAESFIGMMRQLDAAHEKAIREMRAEYNAAMSDMKAEYDTNIEAMRREMDRMAKWRAPGATRRLGRGRTPPMGNGAAVISPRCPGRNSLPDARSICQKIFLKWVPLARMGD